MQGFTGATGPQGDASDLLNSNNTWNNANTFKSVFKVGSTANTGASFNVETYEETNIMLKM